MLRTVTKICSTRLALGHVSQTANFDALTLIFPMPWESEQLGAGFPAVMITTPVPLFEKPA